MDNREKHPNWGGKREGAGRNPKWGCETTVIRVPRHLVGEINVFIKEKIEKERPRVRP